MPWNLLTSHLLPEGFWRPRQPFKILLCCLCCERDKGLCNRSCPNPTFLTHSHQPWSQGGFLCPERSRRCQKSGTCFSKWLWGKVASPGQAGRHLPRTGESKGLGPPSRLGIVLQSSPSFIHLFIRFIGTPLKGSCSLGRKPMIQGSRESLKEQRRFMNLESLISRNKVLGRRCVLQAR